MKGRSILMALESAVLVLALLLGAFLHEVRREAIRPELYGTESRAAVAAAMNSDPVRADERITAYIGLTAEEQARFAAETAAFMKGESETLPSELNGKEQIHMADVRTLLNRLEQVSKGLLALCVLLCISLVWLARQVEHPVRTVLAGVGIGLLLLAVGAGIAALRFTDAFVAVHRLLFTNDYWLMDPAEDIIIRIMPQQLFERAAVHCLQGMLVQSLIILAMLAVITFFMRRLIERWVKNPG